MDDFLSDIARPAFGSVMPIDPPEEWGEASDEIPTKLLSGHAGLYTIFKPTNKTVFGFPVETLTVAYVQSHRKVIYMSIKLSADHAQKAEFNHQLESGAYPGAVNHGTLALTSIINNYSFERDDCSVDVKIEFGGNGGVYLNMHTH